MAKKDELTAEGILHGIIGIAIIILLITALAYAITYYMIVLPVAGCIIIAICAIIIIKKRFWNSKTKKLVIIGVLIQISGLIFCFIWSYIAMSTELIDIYMYNTGETAVDYFFLCLFAINSCVGLVNLVVFLIFSGIFSKKKQQIRWQIQREEKRRKAIEELQNKPKSIEMKESNSIFNQKSRLRLLLSQLEHARIHKDSKKVHFLLEKCKEWTLNKKKVKYYLMGKSKKEREKINHQIEVVNELQRTLKKMEIEPKQEPSPRLLIPHLEYAQMCKDLNRTIFTAEEYKEWKTKPKLCPNCNSRLKSISSDSCDLCGWEKEKKEKKEYMDRPSDYRTCRNCGHKTKIDNIYCSYCKRPSGVSYPIEREKRSRTIPKAVQREVWRRDEGRCVECGTKELLEYDHIIPFSKGGSNTARNIQLLCENCNRKKYNKIGGK